MTVHGSYTINAAGQRVYHPPEAAPGEGGSATFQYRKRYIIFEPQVAHAPTVSVEVLGEGAPTASGGYAKWAHIPRPQRVSLTIFEGYEPMTLTVPILFDAVRNNGLQEDCENQIQWMEWMAGRGIKSREGFTVGVGKPPKLVVYTADGNASNPTPLVPKQFQTANLKWFIDDITWDEHPLRSQGGARIRQAATVRLVQYVQDPAPAQIASEKRIAFKTTHSLNTLAKLVNHYSRGTPTHRKEAVPVTSRENSHNRAIGTNPDKPLKVGTTILIAARFLTA